MAEVDTVEIAMARRCRAGGGVLSRPLIGAEVKARTGFLRGFGGTATERRGSADAVSTRTRICRPS